MCNPDFEKALHFLYIALMALKLDEHARMPLPVLPDFTFSGCLGGVASPPWSVVPLFLRDPSLVPNPDLTVLGSFHCCRAFLNVHRIPALRGPSLILRSNASLTCSFSMYPKAAARLTKLWSFAPFPSAYRDAVLVAFGLL